MTDITETDLGYFERRFRPATVFWRRSLSVLHGIHRWDYHGKRTGKRKKFMEEVLPLSVFARNFECPGRLVKCKYTGRTHGADGVLRLSGQLVETGRREIAIEITTAGPEYAHLQREALMRNGIVFGGSKIYARGSEHRGNREVISVPEVVEKTLYPTDEKENILRALVRKQNLVERENMILLVNYQPENILGYDDWTFLVRESMPAAQDSGFAGVYLVYTDRAIMFRLHGFS